jgi:hypothetical protein
MMVAYLPMFLGKIIFIRDVAQWNLPARWFLRDALLRGDSPFWNPHQGIGLSVASSPLYGVFYPPNWLFLLVPDHLIASMLTWQSFAHLVWGGFGIVLLARRMGANSTGSGVAGLAWSLSGFNTATWTAGLLLHAGSWFPWIALGFIGLAHRLQQGGRGWLWGVAQAAVPLAMLLALGELFLAVSALGFAFATTAAWLLLAQKRDGAAVGQPKWIWFIALALASGLGVGLASVTWLPALAGIHDTAPRGGSLRRRVGLAEPLSDRGICGAQLHGRGIGRLSRLAVGGRCSTPRLSSYFQCVSGSQRGCAGAGRPGTPPLAGHGRCGDSPSSPPHWPWADLRPCTGS